MSKRGMKIHKDTYISRTLRLIRFFLAAHLGSSADIDEVKKMVGEINKKIIAHVAIDVFLWLYNNIICNNQPVLEFLDTILETSPGSSDVDTQYIQYNDVYLQYRVVLCVNMGLQVWSDEVVWWRIASANGCLTR